MWLDNVTISPNADGIPARHFTVLGAPGFIGGRVVDYLQSQKNTVFAPDRNDFRIFSESLGHVIYAIGVTADFRSRPFDTVDAHISVLSSVLRRSKYESFTYLSSTRIYDGAESTNENTGFIVNPADPSDLYNLSKLMGEALCLAQPNDAVRIARLSNVYGDHAAGALVESQNFLEALIYEAVSDGRIELHTSLDSAKDYVAVDDVCQALTQIALTGTERIYNVAAGQNINHAQLTETLAAVTGCSIEVASNSPKIEFPAINITRLSQLFLTEGKDWSPAPLLDHLPHLASAYKLGTVTTTGGSQ